MNAELIARLELNREAERAAANKFSDTARTHNRAMSGGEQQKWNEHQNKVSEITERIVELREQDENTAAAARAFAPYAAEAEALRTGGATVKSEPLTYRKDGDHSFVRDMYMRRQGDSAAAERLARHNTERSEKRAISTTTGAGGEFVPPLWLEHDVIPLARAGRVTTNIVTNKQLPGGTNVMYLPKVNTGTATAPQGTQNTVIQQTDLTTVSVAAPVYTVAGGQTVSMQLLDQSPIEIDQLILSDLVQDYYRQVGAMTVNGAGTGGTFTGLLNLPGVPTVAYTDASPALMGPGKLYAKVAQAVNTVQTSLFLGPDSIVMHPRRWNWICIQVDNSNRPAVLPDGQGSAHNASGISTSPNAQGGVGSMYGLPVYIDPQIPTNLGGGTNQDAIIVGRLSETWFWESNLRLQAMDQTYAQNLSMFLRCYDYVAQATRRVSSLAVIQGTGLVTPTF